MESVAGGVGGGMGDGEPASPLPAPVNHFTHPDSNTYSSIQAVVTSHQSSLGSPTAGDVIPTASDYHGNGECLELVYSSTSTSYKGTGVDERAETITGLQTEQLTGVVECASEQHMPLGSPSSTVGLQTSIEAHKADMETAYSPQPQGTVLELDDDRVKSHSAYLKFICQADPNEFHTFNCRWRHCDQAFVQQEALVSHVNDIHVKMERDVEYRCQWDDCPRKGKGFNARYKMLIHIRTHTNEKPHRCSLCNKSFSRLENLKIHNRSHTGEKPYVCPFEGCHKSYSNSSDRFKHVRTHLTEKPYICKMPGCNKKYTDPSSLRKHVKNNGHYSHRERRLVPYPPHAPSATAASSPTDAIPLLSKDSHMSLGTASSPFVTLAPNLLFNHSLPTQVISVQGSMLHISTLASNPLLSSAVVKSVVNTHTISTQTDTEGGSGRLAAADSPVAELREAVSAKAKEQDLPLDLSTSPVLATGSDDDSSDADNGQYATIWRFITPD